jgi:adenine-specific DNA-methyltransferase
LGIGIHSYLGYLRDRLLIAKELLTESGSCFVQISDVNYHLVRNIMDEVFGSENFVVDIVFTKTGAQNGNLLKGINDYIIWYAKDIEKVKYRPLYNQRSKEDFFNDGFRKYFEDGKIKSENDLEKYLESKREYFRPDPLQSANPGSRYNVELNGKKFYPKGYWKTSEDRMKVLISKGRIIESGNNIAYKRISSDVPLKPTSNVWTDTGGAGDMKYVVQTSEKPIQRCLLMTTDPSDLVLDPTCGSGTTAFVAEQWGRTMDYYRYQQNCTKYC